jgi:hypothetical protein
VSVEELTELAVSLKRQLYLNVLGEFPTIFRDWWRWAAEGSLSGSKRLAKYTLEIERELGWSAIYESAFRIIAETIARSRIGRVRT